MTDPFQHFCSDMQISPEQSNFINHKTLISKVSPPSIYTSTKILRKDRDHLMLDSKQKDLCFYPLLLLYYKLSISSPPLALWAGKLGFVMHSDPKIETNVWLNWVLHIGIQFYLQFLLLFLALFKREMYGRWDYKNHVKSTQINSKYLRMENFALF